MNPKMTKWNWLILHPENLVLGKNTDIGAFTLLSCHHKLVIEDNVQVGSHCAIYTKSTEDNKAGPVILKEGCKIGTHSTVMPGITIGKGAIVGAHSFVNRDIPDGEIWFGVPVKRGIRYNYACTKCGKAVVRCKDGTCVECGGLLALLTENP